MQIFNNGDKIGNYTVVSFIKKGVTAESYCVTGPEGKNYFLKLFDFESIPPALLFDGKEVYEIQLCQELKNENVVSYVGNGEVRKGGKIYHFLVTEYYKGQLLIDSIKQSGLFSPEDAAQVTLCVLNGLNYIHSRALIHNDITPENIILQEVGDGMLLPTIIDLGHISYMVMGRPTFFVEDLMPFFRAPETFKGIYTPKSDLFSTGALFYYMIFGKAPWETDLGEAKGDKHQLKEAVKMARRGELIWETDDIKLGDIYQRILKKALAKNPDDRFVSAADFAKALVEMTLPEEETVGMPSVAPSEENEASVAPEHSNELAITFKKGSGNGFENVAGRDELKEQLRKEVLFTWQNSERAKKYQLEPVNGILLYGPPGCGKSIMVESLAEESGFNYSLIRGSEFGNIYQPNVLENMQRIFLAAAEKAPFVLCLDEIEFLVPNAMDESGAVSPQAMQFAALMNGCAEKGILVAATSNRPDLVDPTIARPGCIDKAFFVPQPDLEARKDIFRSHLKDRPCEELDYDELAKMSDDFVAGDITETVNEAAMTAAYMDVPISQKLLVDVLKYKNPSYSTRTTIGFNKK